jgi:hypothetical protein
MAPLDAAPAPARDRLVLDPSATCQTPPTPPPEPETPRKPRGRPRKLQHKSPVDIAEFDAVAGTIRSIPKDRHPTVRVTARQLAGQDARLSRGPLVLLNRLIDADWATGIYTRSLRKLADDCGLDRSTVTRAFKTLAETGCSLRRPKRRERDWDESEITLPIVARAWAELRDGVGAEKSWGRREKIEGGCEPAPTVGAEKSEVDANKHQGRARENAGGCEKIAALPSADPWSDPRLLGWIQSDDDIAMFKTDEVARICGILAEGLSDEFLRRLALPLDAALVTDAGLHALRTLVAGVIGARYPTDDSEVDTTSMTVGAFNRVAEVIYCCSEDGPLESYERPGAILTDELLVWRFVIKVPQLDAGEQAESPELDAEREMLLALAGAVVSSNAPAEKKLAQIMAAIAAAC